MTETQQPKDLTAQLAELVRATWDWKHRKEWECACEGSAIGCPWPKPSALVAYEQAQAAKVTVPGNDLARLPCHCPARIGDLCQLTSDECRRRSLHAEALPNPLCACAICNDLRADGAGEQQTTDARDVQADLDAFKRWDAKPALAYVLTRQVGNEFTTLRAYDSEPVANAVCVALLMEHPDKLYRVHAVPRVE